MAKRDIDNKPEVKPVVTGKVSKKSKGLFGGFIDKQDIIDVGKTLWEDNFLPDLKKGLFTGIMTLVEAAIYGEVTGRFSRTGGRVNYNSFSSNRNTSNNNYKKGNYRSRYDVDEIVFDQRIDADSVLDAMSEQVERYGCFTIADYYQACRQPHEYTDNNYGWYDMRGIQIVHLAGGGWTIDFPKPQAIED